MAQQRRRNPLLLILASVGLLLLLTSCNLGSSPEQPDIDSQTVDATDTPQATRTLQAGEDRTPLPSLTPIPFNSPTPLVNAVVPPTNRPQPTNTPLPISIVIISPLSGNVVSGNFQIVGSAIHPQFLQYRLEYGQDPNPNNLWFPVTGIVQSPVINGVLGVFPSGVADGNYQIRLRVFLRDGTQQVTQVRNIRLQNQQPTPVPTITTVPRPIASFTQDRTQGEAPLVVRFTNLSQGQIASRTWNFGDGGSNSSQNPTYTYQNPGVYTVTLQVSGPGGTSNVSRQINVTSPSAPDANFQPNTTSGIAPLAVQFDNTSTGQISTYSWDFGDGSTSSAFEPAHVYTDEGTYNVILTVTGSGGSDSVIRQITVENPSIPAPLAGFTPSTTSGTLPLTVTFTNGTTGQVNTYLWDFNGDGITDSTDVSPTQIYNQPGTYNVRLLAIGDGGQTDATATIEVVAPPNAPTADFNPVPTSGTAPLTVNFDNTTTGNVTSYSWDFQKDGVVDSTQEEPSFVFQTAGTYTVVMTATGPGGSTTVEKEVSVQQPPQPPVADFIIDPAQGTAPLDVQFTNQTSGSQLTFEWDFETDGTIDSNEQNPTHRYDNAGFYTITLRVTDANNLSSTKTDVLNVSQTVVIAPPNTAFTWSPQDGQAPVTIQFTNQTTGDVNRYEWDLGADGSVDSTDENPQFQFNQGGTYRVQLTAFGAGGERSIASDVVVADALTVPDPTFSVSPQSGTAPLTVQFQSTAQGTIDSIQWDFDGDGNVDANGAGPHQFVYQTANTYTARMTVTNAAGNRTGEAQVQVGAAAPSADFTVNATSGVAPLTVTFTNASTGDGITDISWDFDGDGNVDANGVGPHNFTYQTPNTYQAQLTVTNATGSDSASIQINVTQSLAASFSASPQSGVAPLAVTFTDASQGNITAWAWDFDGDGNVDANGQAPQPFTYQTAGTFTARLTVTDADGNTGDTTQDIVVSQATQAGFTANPTSGTAPLSVTFSDASTGNITAWAWDFDGDGNVDANGQAPQPFTYQTAGTFTARLTVTDADGNTGDTTQDIVVSQATQAGFTANPTSGTAPLSVTFSDASTGNITAWAWDFDGDGNVDANGQAPQPFTYQTNGTFTARLTVTDADGNTGDATQDITVSQATQAGFTANPTSGIAPLSVTFSDASTGNITAWAWDFDGDGNVDANGQAPQPFTYQTAGTFTARLTVTDADGNTGDATQDITVSQATQAGFTANPTSGLAPLSVTFTDTSTGNITAWTWDFNGDGAPDANGQTPPPFTYQTAGTFTARLTVTDASGATQDATQDIVVSQPVQAGFTANPTSGTAPLTVTFTDTSTGNILTWAWDFNGDGTPDANGQTPPPFTYQTAGTFNARLIVVDSGGNTQEATQQIVVSQAAQASFTANPTSGTAPLTVTFTDTSTGNITAWIWDFNGDGAPDANGQGPHQFVYQTEGTVTARLTITDASGATFDATQDITVSQAAQANFTADPTSGDLPLTVTFTNTSTGNITAWAWDFNNDGAPDANGQGPHQFVYQTEGTVTARLTITDASGATQEATQDITVTAPTVVQPPVGQETIAFATNRDGNFELYVMSADGTGQRNVTNNPAVEDGNPSWSPNGQLLVFNAVVNNNMDIYLVNVATGGTQQITTNAAMDAQAVISPNGQTIAFTTNRGGNNDIYLIDINGGNVRPLTTFPSDESNPSWSPDGSRLTFTSNANGNNDIFVMNADGSGVTPVVTDAANDRQSVWSSNNVIAFVSDRFGDADIFSVAVDGSNLQQLTSSAADDTDPAWSGDGSRLVFTSTRTPDNQPETDENVFIMNADGSGITQLTTVVGADTQPSIR